MAPRALRDIARSRAAGIPAGSVACRRAATAGSGPARRAPSSGSRPSRARPEAVPPAPCCTATDRRRVVPSTRTVRCSRHERSPRPLPRAPRPRPDAGTRRPGAETLARRTALRDPEARRLDAPLRLPPGDRRCPRELGRPQGAAARSPREAPGRAHGGPSARLRGLRGRDPRGRVRWRHRAAVGPGDLPQPARPQGPPVPLHGAEPEGGPAGGGTPRGEAHGRLGPEALPARPPGAVAAHQDARRRRRRAAQSRLHAAALRGERAHARRPRARSK